MTRDINLDDIKKMKYLEQCIKETLRLNPPFSIIGRHIDYPLELENGQIVPKGVNVVVPIILLHNNPNEFPNPSEYNPDRFDNETGNQFHPYSYLPFSSGPRVCIGYKFAYMEAKVILASILRKYYVKSLIDIKDIKIIFRITSKCFPNSHAIAPFL